MHMYCRHETLSKETSFAKEEHMIYDILKSSPSIDDVHGIGEIIRISNQSIMQILYPLAYIF